MPVRAHVAIDVEVIEEHKFACQLVMVGADVFLEETERRIALALSDIAQHLIVAAIFFDDIEHMLDGGGNTGWNRVELFIACRASWISLRAVYSRAMSSVKAGMNDAEPV